MLSVTNTEGEDIGPLISAAAERHGLDPIHLLALLHAESGLNPRAERWGAYTPTAKAAIAREDWTQLAWVIVQAGFDISFGYSQYIVPYHYAGDRTRTVDNCLAVRQHVFNHPEEDIDQAAAKFVSCFAHPSCDGTPLSAMVVYNAGSDRRDSTTWMYYWRANVESYQRSLEWAEDYRESTTPAPPAPNDTEDTMPTLVESLTLIWDRLDKIQEQTEDQAVKDLAESAKQEGVVEAKKTIGLQ